MVRKGNEPCPLCNGTDILPVLMLLGNRPSPRLLYRISWNTYKEYKDYCKYMYYMYMYMYYMYMYMYMYYIHVHTPIHTIYKD